MELQDMPQSGYTATSASRILNLHDKSIFRLFKTGKLDFYIGLDGRMMVSKEELYRYLREHENGTVVSYVRR